MVSKLRFGRALAMPFLRKPLATVMPPLTRLALSKLALVFAAESTRVPGPSLVRAVPVAVEEIKPLIVPVTAGLLTKIVRLPAPPPPGAAAGGGGAGGGA